MPVHSNSYLVGHTTWAINMPGGVRNHPQSFHKAVGKASVCPCLPRVFPAPAQSRIRVTFSPSVRLRCFLPSCYEANWWVKSPMPHKCQCAQLRWFHNVMKAERQKENQSWARACNISQLQPGVNAIRPTHWNQRKASGWSDLITSDLVCKFVGVENIHLLHILSCYSLKFNFSPQNFTHNAS